MIVRAAQDDELDHLARLWHDAWRDGHAALAPPGLLRARTPPRFRARLDAMRADLRVAGPAGAPLGFCVLQGDELYQLFVAREARGSGVAAALLDDGEARLAARGVKTAWLGCAVGNDRAARFYERRGWTRAGTQVIRLTTEDGAFDVPHWRYEKAVSP